MAIDDAVVKLEFEGQNVIVTGKPETPHVAKILGVDYYLGFLLRDRNTTGGETFYAGFITAKIEEDKGGRTYFFPVSMAGLAQWVLYAGAAEGMEKRTCTEVKADN